LEVVSITITLQVDPQILKKTVIYVLQTLLRLTSKCLVVVPLMYNKHA